MKRIIKYNLERDLPVEIHSGCLLKIGIDRKDDPVAWAIEPYEPLGEDAIELHLFYTGDEIPDGLQYLETLIHNPTGMVYHIFRKLLPEEL